MKKLLSMGLIASLSVTGLAACGNETETATDSSSNTTSTDESSSTASGEKVEVKVWLDNDDFGTAMETAIEAALPNIDIIYEKVGSVDSVTKLELDGPAGLGADVFMMPHDHMSNATNAQLLLPLGAEIGADLEERFLEASVGTVKVGDAYYAAPLSIESVALFYNKTLLDEAGFEVATSFEQIKEQAAQYNDAASNKFLMRFEAGNTYAMHCFLTAGGFELYGPDHNDPSQVNINSEGVVKGLTFYQSMREYLDVPYADLNWDSIEVEFAKGNVPYIITGPWSIGEVQNQDAGFEWGVTTIPTIDGVQPETFSGNVLIAASAYTQHPEEARQVIEFMTSEEGLQVMYDVKGTIPALKDATVVDGVSEDPYIMGVLEQAKYSQPMPSLPEMSSYWTAAGSLYGPVWDGQMTPEEAAEKALQDYNIALELSK